MATSTLTQFLNYVRHFKVSDYSLLERKGVGAETAGDNETSTNPGNERAIHSQVLIRTSFTCYDDDDDDDDDDDGDDDDDDDDCFYTALFSALLSRLTALACDSMSDQLFIARF